MRPELVKLARVIEQLGRAAGGIVVTNPTPREPVPDWLAERLVFTVGMQREAVAALDLQEAVDLWTTFMTKLAKDM